MRQFLLFVFVLLVPCFALWTMASATLAMPATGLVNMLLKSWFPDVVEGVYVQGADALLMTQFGELQGRLVTPQAAAGSLGFKIDTRILSYAIAFYTALHFATPRRDYLADYLWGLVLIYPFIVLGLLCVCLKELVVNLGATFLQQPDVFVPPADAIAVLFQLSTLIVPTLVPALVWLGQSRDTALLRGLLPRIEPASKANQST